MKFIKYIFISFFILNLSIFSGNINIVKTLEEQIDQYNKLITLIDTGLVKKNIDAHAIGNNIEKVETILKDIKEKGLANISSLKVRNLLAIKNLYPKNLVDLTNIKDASIPSKTFTELINNETKKLNNKKKDLEKKVKEYEKESEDFEIIHSSETSTEELFINDFIKQNEELIKKINIDDYSTYDDFLNNYWNILKKLNQFKKEIQALAPKNEKEIIQKIEESEKNLKKAYNKGPWNDGKATIQFLNKNGKLLEPFFENLTKSNELYLKTLSQIIWYFYEIAVKKDQSFNEGSFKIEDPKKIIFNFFKNKAKPRISSHYHEFNNQQYGISIPDSLRNKYRLPNKKSHILFGELNNQYIFVKPETYGLDTWSDWTWHAVEYIESLSRKYISGSDEAPGMKKEHVPKKIIEAWNKLISNLNIKEDKELLDAKKTGIAKMIKTITFNPKFKAVKNKLDEVFKAKYSIIKGAVEKVLQENPKDTELDKSIKKLISQFYDYDKLEVRKGQEVIINANDLK